MTDQTLDNTAEVAEDDQALETEQPEEVTEDVPTADETDNAQSEESTESTTPQLAGKFSTTEDLEKAYKELEKKFHETNQQKVERTFITNDEDINQISDEIKQTLPKDIMGRIVKDILFQDESSNFDKEAKKNPHIIEKKEKLMELAQYIPKYKTTPYAEIYKSEFGDTPVQPSARQAASAPKSNNASVKSGGKKKWTQEAIDNVSAADWKKYKPEIVEYLSSKK